MTKTSRFVTLAVASVSALTFTACGGKTVDTTTSSSTTTTATDAGSSATTTASDATSATDSTSATDTSSASGSGAVTCVSGKIVGGGSTAQSLAMQNLTSDYKSQCAGATIEYTGTGSGAGIKDFYNGQIDWAGSDSALKSVKNADGVIEKDKVAAACGSEGWDLPTVVGPIAYAYNVKGVDHLTLTPKVIAEIFMGKITTWDDAQIKALNTGVTLPSEKINVFYRSDDSGTSENVSKYLKAASGGAWTPEPAKKWAGTVGEGKKGTQSVAQGVSDTEGGFGYMEWKFAKDLNLGVSAIDNGAGAVDLTTDTVAKAVEGATVKGTGNDLALSLKYTDTGAGAYPSLLVTYEIVCSQGKDATKTALLKSFLTYATSKDVQDGLSEQGYAPLPETLRVKVQTAIAAMK